MRKGRPTNVLGQPALNMQRRLELANNRTNTMVMEDEVTAELAQRERGERALFPTFVTPSPFGGRTRMVDWSSNATPTVWPNIWSFERDWADAVVEQRTRQKPKA